MADLFRRAERLGYRPALDGLRALALVVIFWHHTLVGLKPAFLGSVRGGFVGVDLFFVLSGFLITTLMLERREKAKGRIEFRDFYRRRALRLLPALVLFLVVSLAIAWASNANFRLEVKTALAALTYTTNYLLAFGGVVSVDKVHLWTLAVEEQFYLLWPLAMLVLVRLRPKLAKGILVAAILATCLWRWQLADWAGGGNQAIYMRTDARADALLIGALLAFTRWTGWRPAPRASTVIGAAGLVAWTVLFVRPTALGISMYNGGFTVVAVLTAAMIVGGLSTGGPVARLLAWRPLVEIGRMSYGLYLWHVPAFVLAIQLVSVSSPARYLVAYGLTGAFAVASFHLVERPFMTGATLRSMVRPLATRAVPQSSSPLRLPRAPRPAAVVGLAVVALLVGGSSVGALAQRAMERRGEDQAIASFEADPGNDHESGSGSSPTVTVPSATTSTTVSDPVSPPADVPDPAIAGPDDGGSGNPIVELIPAELAVNPPVVDVVGRQVRVSATLHDGSSAPLPGRVVRFRVLADAEELGCEAVTTDAGEASCTVSPAIAVPVSQLGIIATHPGDATTAAATGSWPT